MRGWRVGGIGREEDGGRAGCLRGPSVMLLFDWLGSSEHRLECLCYLAASAKLRLRRATPTMNSNAGKAEVTHARICVTTRLGSLVFYLGDRPGEGRGDGGARAQQDSSRKRRRRGHGNHA